jgi:lysophospholipase L1-like esterase
VPTPTNTTLLSDFNGTNGNSVTNFGNQNFLNYGNWGNIVYQSNQGAASINNYSGATYTSSQFGPDVDFHFQIPTLPPNGLEVGCHFRLANINNSNVNGYLVAITAVSGNDEILVSRIDNNSTYVELVAVQSASTNFANGGWLHVVAVGARIWVDWSTDGSNWTNLIDVTDGSPRIQSGYIALYTNSSTTRFETLRGGNYAFVPDYTVTASDWFFSPGNWYKSGSSYALTNNPGAYMKFAFSGTGLVLGVDTSVLSALSPGSDAYPRLRYKIDNGSWSSALLTSGQTSITLATGLSNGAHTALVVFRGISNNTDDLERWSVPQLQLRVTGVTVTGGSLTTPSLLSQRWLVFGDSITEGAHALASGEGGEFQDASEVYGLQVAANFNAEVGIVGFSAQGYDHSPGDVPEFHVAGGANSWDELFSGQSRSFSGIDTILVAHGANDFFFGESTSAVEADVEDFLADFRAANPSIRIYLCIPFGGFIRTTITNAFNDYQTATPDVNCFLIDISQENGTLLEALDGDGTFSTYSTDGTHPNQAGHDLIASLLIAAIDELVAPTQHQYAYRFRNDDGSETGASWLAAQNTSVTVTRTTPFRLRTGIDATNDPDSGQYTLQYRKVGSSSGDWHNVS